MKPTPNFVSRSVCIAAVIAIGALGNPAVANAVWDIEAYDRCVADLLPPNATLSDIERTELFCCENTGGNWNVNQFKCESPPAQGPGPDTPTSPKVSIPTVQVKPPTVGNPPTSPATAVPMPPSRAG